MSEWFSAPPEGTSGGQPPHAEDGSADPPADWPLDSPPGGSTRWWSLARQPDQGPRALGEQSPGQRPTDPRTKPKNREPPGQQTAEIEVRHIKSGRPPVAIHERERGTDPIPDHELLVHRACRRVDGLLRDAPFRNHLPVDRRAMSHQGGNLEKSTETETTDLVFQRMGNGIPRKFGCRGDSDGPTSPRELLRSCVGSRPRHLRRHTC